MTRFIVLTLLSLLLTGCAGENGVVSKEKLNQVEQERENQLEESREELRQAQDQLDQLNEQLDDLHNQNKRLEEEKRAFFQADQYGRELYHAMVHADVKQLESLTSSKIDVFEDFFEIDFNDETIQIPFQHLQTEAHLNNEVIVKTNGYGYDEDSEKLMIFYMMIDYETLSASHLKITLKQIDGLKWEVDAVDFDT